MKVAVVGSGLAGLTTAYLLRKEGNEVYLIEKSDRLGFHSQSVEINSDGRHPRTDLEERGSGGAETQRWIVDVPMRGFQGGYYPLLLSLYQHLNIPLTPTCYTFSFSSSISTYFIHSGSSGYSIPSLPSGAFVNPLTLLRDILTLLGVALCYLLLVILSFLAWHDLLPSSLSSPNLTLKEFTVQLSSFLARPITIPLISWSPWTPLGDTFEFFIAQLIIPLFSAVGTMTVTDVWSLPVRIILEYVHVTLGTSHYHLARGHSAADVACLLSESVLAQGVGHLRTSTEIVGLAQSPEGGIKVTLRESSLGSKAETSVDGAETEEIVVDRVVLATQASVARRLLESLEKDMKHSAKLKESKKVGKVRKALNEVAYRETIVITHRDNAILPKSRDRRDLNFFLPSSKNTPPTFSSPSSTLYSGSSDVHPSDETPYFSPKTGPLYTMTTQVIPHPHSKGETVLQTTNPVIPIDPSKVLSVSRLERALPLRNPDMTLPILRSDTGRIHIVGSYAYPGIPLLEGCVGSAKLTVEAILRMEHDQLANSREKEAVSESEIGSERTRGVAGINWDIGQGGLVERAWRWRWTRRRS